MKKELVYSTICSLAHSQGFYGRLLNALNELDEDALNEFYRQFDKCHDAVDVVMTLEA
jgi:hypothetical protein